MKININLWIYAVEKSALDKANHQLYYQGVDTTIVRFGLFDSPRVEHIDKKKMSIDYCVSIIDWVLQQKHRVKEITISLDLDKIKKELEILPEYNEQIIFKVRKII